MVIDPCAKYGYPMSMKKKHMGRTRNMLKTPINLTLRSNFKVVSWSWMYATHSLMVIHSCANLGSQCQTKISYVSDTKTCKKNLLNLTLRSKFKVISGSWMNARQRLMVKHPCARYGRLMSNQKRVMGRTRKHVKNPINLTLRSKFKFVSGSRMYVVSYLLMVTDRQGDSYIIYMCVISGSTY